MPFGILIHMPRVLQHGTINLLLVNLKIIVIMNQNLEHVKVFIPEVDWELLFHFKELISSSFFLFNNRAFQKGNMDYMVKYSKKTDYCLGDF
ncbi:hypothetical protein SRABI134_03736 [Peribacillus sp. Bi134]|nr:hypothetical protein SRABI134_03736 [Peribacillus sp. Bi134]